MEACGSAHYWARELVAMGHEVVLIPPAYIKPYVKRGKNDAARRGGDLRGDVAPRHAVRADQERGSAGRADAAQDPRVDGQAAHDERQCAARPSGGVRPRRRQGHRPRRRTARAGGQADAISAGRSERRRRSSWPRIWKGSIDRSTRRRKKSPGPTPEARRDSCSIGIPGVGPLIASAIAASVPDPGVFKSGRDFAAWLGLTPRQNSSGGKAKLGAITKQGNRYIRKMLVVGCTLGAARRQQTQRRPCRMDRRVEGEKAGAPGRGGARQQAGENLLGDHDDRRSLPPGDLRQGIE